MSFGGAGPGMAILMGVAQGVARADKRRREMEQEAIRKALWARQIEESQERMQVAREQEQRYRENAIAEAKLKVQQEENKRLERQAELAAQRERLDAVQAEIMRENPGQDPAVAYQQAETVIQDDIPWSQFKAEDPADQLPPGGIAGARWQHELAEERKHQLAMEKLYDSPSAMASIGAAQTLTDAIMAGQAHGIAESAVRDYWVAGGKGRMEKEDPTVLSYPEMTGTQQRGVDRIATQLVDDAWVWAEWYKTKNPNSPVPMDELAYNYIVRQKGDAEWKHREGMIYIDDFQMAALGQADLIFQQSMEDYLEKYGDASIPEGRKKF